MRTAFEDQGRDLQVKEAKDCQKSHQRPSEEQGPDSRPHSPRHGYRHLDLRLFASGTTRQYVFAVEATVCSAVFVIDWLCVAKYLKLRL